MAFAILAFWLEHAFTAGPISSFINDIWSDDDTMRHHLLVKWDGICSDLRETFGGDLKDSLIGPLAAVRFIGKLDQDNLRKLEANILKKNECWWGSPHILSARRLFEDYMSVPRTETLLEFLLANSGDAISDKDKLQIYLDAFILFEDDLDILDGQYAWLGDKMVIEARQKN